VSVHFTFLYLAPKGFASASTSTRKAEALEFESLRVDLRGMLSRAGKFRLSLRPRVPVVALSDGASRTTLSRGEILEEVWNYDAKTFTRTVDVHMASLRQKLEDDPKHPQWILPVPGLGYRFAN
jgi:two-component system, OmpR family, alkaline phosphatase synthesis response regulator PhoP